MNPYRSERLAHGLTQLALARECGITSQVIGNLEVGLFYKPPISVTNYFDDPSLEQRYKVWVRNERALNALILERFLNQPNDTDWVTFRLAVSPSFRGFCRIIVFQPSMLKEFEDRGINRGALNIALKQCGVDRERRTMLLYRKGV